MRRREFISLIGSVAATLPLAAHAQQSAMPVIGFVNVASAKDYTPLLSAFLKGLSEAGFVDGRNASIEYRWAEGQFDRLPALANELVARGVNVIVATGGLQAAHAAMASTKTIPIVFSTDGDPVGQGLVSNLNRPAGNATGITVFSASLTAKRLEVLHQIVPNTKLSPSLLAIADEVIE